MTGILQDVRYAMRSLAKTPAIAIVTVLTFALGIGANTAVFSVVDAVLLRPLTYANPERLVVLHETVPPVGRIPVGVVEFEEWGKAATSFEQLALIAVSPVILTGTGEPERLEAARVSASLFPMLGVSPAIGRTFSADEEVIGRHHVVVLSDRLWRRRFGADSSIIGRAITLNDERFVVAGVLPQRFRFPRLERLFAMNVSGGQPELWMPFAPTARDRTENSYAVIARLGRGVTIDRAREELQSIQHRYAQRMPNPPQLGADVVPLQDQVVGQSLGIRLALGATRTSVHGMVIGAVLRLVGLGLAVGVPLAIGAGYAMRSVLFGVSPHSPAMLATSSGLIVLVALVAAAIPARRAARVDPLLTLRSE